MNNKMRKIRVIWCWDFYRHPLVREILPPNKFEIMRPKDESELRDQLVDADFLVVRRLPKISEELIGVCKRLKLIQRVGDALDNIDVQAAKNAGIRVEAVPSVIDTSVAEHAMMMMLALSKKLIQAHRMVAEGYYEKLGLKAVPTTESIIASNWVGIKGMTTLYKKTLGLVGLGVISREVAKRAKSFEMTALYYQRHKLSKEEDLKLDVQYADFDDLLKESDYISLHIPHTKENDKMFGKRELSLMKPTAFLINTSRGGVIDEEALYWALDNHLIAGAGLDVFREEPAPKDNPLLDLDNVILTPHIAGCEFPHPSDLTTICRNILEFTREA
jgi:D-3-phosphoglycerate dehydrogenase